VTGTVAPPGPSSRPVRKPELAAVLIDGERVVYSPESDALHRLDGTASVVWAQLTGNVTVAMLANELAAAFDTEPSAVLEDVLTLVDGLWRRGLLEGSEANPEFTGRDPAAERGGPVVDAPTTVDGPLPTAPYRTTGCRAFEHRFSVATNLADVRDYVDYILRDLADPHPVSAPGYEVIATRNGTFVLRYRDDIVAVVDRVDRALSTLLWHINTEAARMAVARGPVVHAAAAIRHRATVLMPAPQESGKTTTVAGLVRAGFDYLSDEAVAIDRHSLLPEPFPKALSIDAGSWDVLADLRPDYSDQMVGQWQVPATAIRPDALGTPQPIRFVVIPTYEPGARTRLEPIARAETLVKVADSTFHFWDAPQRNLDVLAQMLRSASCYRLTLSDLGEGVRLINELVASEQLDIAE
jgi:Coenzyme PQQ synthesis protein D (PqqD)